MEVEDYLKQKEEEKTEEKIEAIVEETVIEEVPSNIPDDIQKQIDEEKKYTLTARSDEDLKKLAVDLYESKLFSTLHLNPESAAHDARMVFMPLALGAFADWPEDKLKNIGMIYEYYGKEAPTSCNGLPCFFSFSMISSQDLKRMLVFLEKYKKLKEEF